MWTNEVIFSFGDLASDDYDDYIADNYGDIAERLDHVNNMIERLIYERDVINSKSK